MHEGCLGVSFVGVCDYDLGVVHKGYGGEGCEDFGNGGSETCTHVVFLDDGEEDGTYADPEDRAETASLSCALEGWRAGAETVCCAKSSLNKVGHMLKSGDDTGKDCWVEA